MVRSKKTELAVFSRLFSSAVFREMAKKGRSGLFKRLAGEVGLSGLCNADATVGDAFDLAFGVLRVAGQRDEYIYRSAISHKILMGTHSLRTASMLTEFRAGTCKADLVILNGTATVYEIKSERDSLARLANQVANYKKVFAKVNVIASEDHVEGVIAAVPEDIGVLCLSKRYQISTEREGVNRPDRICPQTVFESLRSAEAAAILRALGRAVPQVPNTLLHGALRTIFAELDPSMLHNEMVRTLKRTRNLTPLVELVDQLPESLQAAAISIPVKRSEHIRLVEAVRTPLSIAMAWS
ncbi:sce7726 family protein [Rhizobium leguminosarum]|uniref:sce7726 family protein n=1 Tax=Rhizobium leguminosarum TaxID=384 RepID=UPI0004757552|nr:sce7726 family protein [Rhizobium leguminosarum]